MWRFFILLLALFDACSIIFGKKDCNKRQYKDSNSFVCVCSSSFCDTIEPLEESEIGIFQEYVSSRKEFRLNKFTKKLQVTNKLLQLLIKQILNTIFGKNSKFH